MRKIVNCLLLSFICVAFSGGFIISQEAPHGGAPSQEVEENVSQAAQESGEAEGDDLEIQQTIPPEEIAGPEVGVMEGDAGLVGVVGEPEVKTEETKKEDAPVKEVTAEEKKVQEAAQAASAQKEEPEEAVQVALPEEEELPKPEEEAEVISEDKPTEVPAVPSELKGIDTLEINEPGGNWLVKRMWWEKAEEKMEKIDSAIDIIMESRMVFFEKRDKTDSELFDNFYIEIGLDQGQLEEISSFMIQELKTRREKQDVLNKQELAFLKKLEAEKDVLKEVRIEVDAVRKLDDAIDAVLTKLLEQINLARKYRREGQQFFKDIAKVLDHERARELYYKMDASWQNIKGIQNYISGTFTQHFNQLVRKAEEQTSRIKSLMADLEKKGLGFKAQLKKLRGQKEDVAKKQLEREQQEELKEEREQEVEEAPGIFGTMISMIGTSVRGLFDWVGYLGTSAWNWATSWWRPAVSTEAVLEEQEIAETVKKDA